MAVKLISNSIRLNDDDSAHTVRTLANSDGTLWTFSFWVKRGNLSSAMAVFSAGSSAGAEESTLRFTANDELQLEQITSSATVTDIKTDALFRDPTAWYHIVVAYDSDQAASADRIAITVNGVAASFVETNAIDSGRTVHFNEADPHAVGRNNPGADEEFDGYLADVYFVDGAALAATTFGEVAANGTWQPITAAPTFGTNGFQLDFAVAPGTGNGAGTDVSGNANHFTDSGLAANDQHTDSPTNNVAVLNPLQHEGAIFSQGNRVMTGPVSAAWKPARGTIWADTGKWYFEATVEAITTSNLMFGWLQYPGNTGAKVQLGSTNFGWGIQWIAAGNEIRWIHNGANTALTATGTLAVTDVVGIAIDIDAGKIWFRYNGTWLDSGNPGAGTNEIILDATISDFIGAPCIAANNSSNQALVSFNSDDLSGSIPTDFKTFQISSLPNPAIQDPSQHFDVISYAGNNTNPRTFSSLNFAPNIVWLKGYDSGTPTNLWADSVRGVDIVTFPSLSSAETSTNVDGDISSFDANGFKVDAGGTGDDDVNDSAFNYVAYAFNESPAAGIDIVTYTGNAAAQTLGHSLNGAPSWMTVKNRDAAENWIDYVDDLMDTGGIPRTSPEDFRLVGDNSSVVATAANAWNNTAPTDTQFTIGTDLSTNLDSFIAYLFEKIPGFSHIGSYVGNSATSGNFVWTGFYPKFLIIKNLNSGRSWTLFDAQRTPNNPRDRRFFRDTDVIDVADNALDFVANGFHLRNSLGNETNITNAQYAFIAFAEMPFKLASAFILNPNDAAVTMDMSISGVASQPKSADGAVTASLSVAARTAANGAVTTTMSVAGTVTNATIHGDAALTLSMSVAAAAGPQGAVTAAMSVAATGFIKIRADGALSMTLSVAVTASLANFGRLVATMAIAATGTRTSLILGTSVAVPVVATNGILVNSALLEAPNVVIPPPAVAGVIDNGITGIGNLLLPFISIIATMASEGDVVIPVPQVTATMVAGRVLTGTAVPVPRVGLDGAVTQDTSLFGSVPVVNVKVNGIVLAGATLSVLTGLDVPNPQVDATILAGQILETPLVLHSISGTRNTGAKFCP